MHQFVDKDFHGICAISNRIQPAGLVAMRQKKVIHATYAGDRVTQAGCHTGTKCRRQDNIGSGRYPKLTLEKVNSMRCNRGRVDEATAFMSGVQTRLQFFVAGRQM